MGSRSEGILGWFGFGISGPDMLRGRGGGRVSGGKGGTTVPGIVSCLLVSEASSFFHVFSSFDWGELRQGDSVDLHGIGVLLGIGREMDLEGDLSCLKGEDSHFLGMEDLGLINPSSAGGGNSGHGEDHGGNLLINSEGELIDEVELLLDSCLE